MVKFSHRFQKMPHDTTFSWLVGVSVCDIALLPDEFIEYDTTYPGGSYPMPPAGKHIILTIFTRHPAAPSFSRAWTTIRTWDAEKETYYRSLIGRRIPIEAPPAPPSVIPPTVNKHTLEWYNNAGNWTHCTTCARVMWNTKVCPDCKTDMAAGAIENKAAAP